ncbi:gluconate 2-dehydrogenase subunit 3 family protein [Arsenicibacter rosenii]|nr:gluconate 2-dehydrogenase subunit 3 family protein [Arsenicibacter rosenii]
MNRRDALMRVAAFMGATMSFPALADTLEASVASRAATGAPVFLTADQDVMVAELAEVIIPTTNTPGAKAAKVNEIIDVVLKDCYKPADQQRFKEGLDRTNQIAKGSFNKSFVECDNNQRIEVVKMLEQEAKKQRKDMAGAPASQRYTPFFAMLKDLTLMGYFTSEIGCTQALEYVAVPGRYDGCITLKPGQKAWAI